jgi:hypothetical protein
LSDFILEDDEWVTEIRGRAGSRIDQVQFFLNSGRVSPVYGGNGGQPFVLKKDKNIVKSFFGRSGSGVDQLGVYFEDAKPIKVLITKMDYDISAAQILDMNPEVVQTVLLKNDFLYNPYCFDADAVNSLC